MSGGEDDITEMISRDYSEEIKRTNAAKDFDLSELQIGRMNRLLIRYVEDVDAEWTTQLRGQSGNKAKTTLIKLNSALQALLVLWKDSEKNLYVRGPLIDAYCGPPKVNVPEYDDCITVLGAFGEQLESVARAIQQATTLPLDRDALPVFRAGRQPDNHRLGLIEGLGSIVEEILRDARKGYAEDDTEAGDKEFYAILQEILRIADIELTIKALRNRTPLSR